MAYVRMDKLGCVYFSRPVSPPLYTYMYRKALRKCSIRKQIK